MHLRTGGEGNGNTTDNIHNNIGGMVYGGGNTSSGSGGGGGVHGAAPSSRLGGTALHLAAGAGHLAVVEILVEGGAQVMALDKQGHSGNR